MKKLIRRVINEIIFKADREKFNWRYVHTITKPHKKVHVTTFRTPTYKYIVNAEEYDNHFYLISFYPVLGSDFDTKQYRRATSNQTYHDKYSYETNEKVITKADQERLSKLSKKEKEKELKKLPPMAFKILALIISYMNEILEKDPLASFGYYGAPDIKGGSNVDDEDIEDTQRFRVYRLMLDNEFKNTHVAHHRESYSGSIYVNKEAQKKFPGIVEYGLRVLQGHL